MGNVFSDNVVTELIRLGELLWIKDRPLERPGANDTVLRGLSKALRELNSFDTAPFPANPGVVFDEEVLRARPWLTILRLLWWLEICWPDMFSGPATPGLASKLWVQLQQYENAGNDAQAPTEDAGKVIHACVSHAYDGVVTNLPMANLEETVKKPWLIIMAILILIEYEW